MSKPTRKVQTFFFGTMLVLVIIFLNVGNLGIGGEGRKVEEDKRAEAVLEGTLGKIEGVGEVELYFHYNKDEEMNPLSDYFSLSQTKAETRTNNIEGILVVAEGGGDPLIRNTLSGLLATVLQLPEHRIVIVEMSEMKKGRNLDENK